MRINFDKQPPMHGSQVMSPWPARKRVFSEPNSKGELVAIGPGRTVPDLAKLYYNAKYVQPIKYNFPFLSRDFKDRDYNPGVEDPFVFSSWSSVDLFKRQAIDLINFLMTKWRERGWPVKHDDDRDIDLPDAQASIELLPKLTSKERELMMFIVSNVDILKKTCVIREINPGWWLVSYAGKDAEDAMHFRPSLIAHIKAFEILKKSPKFRRIREETFNDTSDPLDTNVGYPMYTAHVTSDLIPITRLQTIAIYKGAFKNVKTWTEIKTVTDQLCPIAALKGFPFAVSSIRRSQYGRKWSHIFNFTDYGMTTSFDYLGSNTTRVAFAVPYLFNLLTSPAQIVLKSFRKMLPGLYHDGESRKRRLYQLRSKNPLMLEADYSNYDRYIPVNLLLALVSGCLKYVKDSELWNQLYRALHYDLPLIWPDYSPHGSLGWLFYPGKVGLFSGVKVTSESGTLLNSVVCLQSVIDAGIISERDAVDYLIQYRDDSSAIGSKEEYYYVQSDDTLLLHTDPHKLKALGEAFNVNAARAGLKGEVSVADRFLMRHMMKGIDAPVLARIWHNTMQNEEPVTSPLKYLVGLVMRSDGALGHKTFDPFDTGRLRPIPRYEIEFTLKIFKSLAELLSQASKVHNEALKYINVIIRAASSMLDQCDDTFSSCRLDADAANLLDNIRIKALNDLAILELRRMDGSKLSSSYLYQLHKDAHSPSSSMLLDSIVAYDNSFISKMADISDKEHTFYLYAMKTLGIDPMPDI
jgi:hypothetical protein